MIYSAVFDFVSAATVLIPIVERTSLGMSRLAGPSYHF